MSVLTCDSLPSPNLLLHWLHLFSFSQQHNYVVLLQVVRHRRVAHDIVPGMHIQGGRDPTRVWLVSVSFRVPSLQ